MSTQHSVLLERSVIGDINFVSIEFECRESPKEFHNELSTSSFSSLKTNGSTASLDCSMNTSAYSEYFYILGLSSTSTQTKSPEFSCHFVKTNWICRPTDSDDSLPTILRCNQLQSIKLPVGSDKVGSPQPSINCFTDSEFILYKDGTSSSIKAYFHRLYPLVEEVILKIDTFTSSFILIDGEINYSFAGNQELKCKTKNASAEDLENGYLRLPSNNISKNLSMVFEYNDSSGLKKFSWILHDVLVTFHFEILSSTFNTNQGIIHIIASGISKSYKYNIHTRSKQEISCTVRSLVEDSINEYIALGILTCHSSQDDLTNIVRLYDEVLLILKDQANVEADRFFVNLTITNGYFSGLTTLANKEAYLDLSYIVIIVERVSLSSWLIQNHNTNIIECNFFDIISISGSLGGIDRIICPIPEQFYYILEASELDYYIDISIGEYIHVMVSEALFNEGLQNSQYNRMLGFTFPLPFSPLNPQIIKSPEQEVDVSILHILYCS